MMFRLATLGIVQQHFINNPARRNDLFAFLALGQELPLFDLCNAGLLIKRS
jgi:hypothetical protein